MYITFTFYLSIYRKRAKLATVKDSWSQFGRNKGPGFFSKTIIAHGMLMLS